MMLSIFKRSSGTRPMLLMSLVCVLWLSGCGNRIVPPSRTAVLVPHDALLANCQQSQTPPTVADLLPLTKTQLIAVLGRREIQHQADFDTCNQRWAAVREWKRQQFELYHQMQ